jgi:tetratricopeptide (TPR) repeat protein
MLVGALGAQYPRARPLAQRLADFQRAADQLPESAEAHFILGDFLYHRGSALDVTDAIPRARAAFERSVALDSQALALGHLLEIALITGDTALAQRAWVGYDRLVGGAWDWGMAVAALRGEQAMLAAQRLRAGSIQTDRLTVTQILQDAPIPAAAAEEIIDLTDRYQGPNMPAENRWFFNFRRFLFATVHGRPAAALRAATAMAEVSRDYPELWRDPLLAVTALFADGDSAAGAAALQRLRALSTRDTTVAGVEAACVVAFQDLRGEGRAMWNEDLVRRDPRCGSVLVAVRAVRERAPDALEGLRVADSVSRNNLDFGQPGFDRLALARAWEAFGDVPRALAAIRLRFFHGTGVVEATRCREEGRLAALAGDTTGAIAAYRRFLALRQDAEPVLVPQRDSVRAELARLERHP